MNDCELITRKDIARRLGMSTDFLRRNEERLGFTRAKVVLSRKVIRYRAPVVEEVFALIFGGTCTVSRTRTR